MEISAGRQVNKYFHPKGKLKEKKSIGICSCFSKSQKSSNQRTRAEVGQKRIRWAAVNEYASRTKGNAELLAVCVWNVGFKNAKCKSLLVNRLEERVLKISTSLCTKLHTAHTETGPVVHSLMIRFPYGPIVKKKKAVGIFFFFYLAKVKIAARKTRLGNHRLTMHFVFLQFGTLTIQPPSCTFGLQLQTLLTEGNISSSHNLLADGERKAVWNLWLSLTQPGSSSRPGWDPDDVRGFSWKRRLQRSRLFSAAWQRLSRGHQRDARRRRSHRHSCRISHLWLCSICTLLMRRKCNQQAK